jgi:hypothetical protein
LVVSRLRVGGDTVPKKKKYYFVRVSGDAKPADRPADRPTDRELCVRGKKFRGPFVDPKKYSHVEAQPSVASRNPGGGGAGGGGSDVTRNPEK